MSAVLGRFVRLRGQPDPEHHGPAPCPGRRLAPARIHLHHPAARLPVHRAAGRARPGEQPAAVVNQPPPPAAAAPAPPEPQAPAGRGRPRPPVLGRSPWAWAGGAALAAAWGSPRRSLSAPHGGTGAGDAALQHRCAARHQAGIGRRHFSRSPHLAFIAQDDASGVAHLWVRALDEGTSHVDRRHRGRRQAVLVARQPGDWLLRRRQPETRRRRPAARCKRWRRWSA